MNINAKSYIIGTISMLIPALILDWATQDIAPFACVLVVLLVGSISYLWGSHDLDGAYYDGWNDAEGFYDPDPDGDIDEMEPTTEEPKKENNE